MRSSHEADALRHAARLATPVASRRASRRGLAFRRSRTLALLLLTAALPLVAACGDGDGRLANGEEAGADGAGGSEAEGAGAPPAGAFVFRVPVTWGLAEPGVVSQTVELVGDVRSRRWAELAFERAGRIVEVRADLGDAVQRGAVLARLDDAVLREELAVARAREDVARSELEWAEREAHRAEEAGPIAISAAERDRRGSAASANRARLAEAVAEAGRLSALLAQGELLAPFDGVIVRRAVTEGSHAAAGTPAFTLADLEHREVHLEIPADVAATVTRGAEVALRVDALPGVAWTARLDELVPAADLATRTFTGVVRLDGLDPVRRLLPGLFVRARFDRARVESRTVVPKDAVIQGPEGSHVVVMDLPEPPRGLGDDAPAPRPEDGGPPAPVARLVPVRVLARDATRAAVEPLDAGGLVSGAHVVVTGADNAFPGAVLAPVPPIGAAGARAAGAASQAEPAGGPASRPR